MKEKDKLTQGLEPRDYLPRDPKDVARHLAKAMSHDMRSPFNASIAVLHLVLEDFETLGTADIKELLQSLLDNNKAQLWHADTLQFYARMELGILAPQPRPTPIPSFFNYLGLEIPPGLPQYSLEFDPDWTKNALEILKTALELCIPKAQIQVAWAHKDPHHGISLSVEIINSHDDVDCRPWFPTLERPSSLPTGAGTGFMAATRGFLVGGWSILASDTTNSWIFTRT